MRYIDRNESEQIVCHYACEQYPGQEFLEEDSAEMAAFIEQQKKLMINDDIKIKLSEIDLKSIRSIREWLLKQADAPKILIEHEVAAIAEREKLVK